MEARDAVKYPSYSAQEDSLTKNYPTLKNNTAEVEKPRTAPIGSLPLWLLVGVGR